MSDKWEDRGHHEGIPILGDLGQMITGQEERHIHNTETGEDKIATVVGNQTLGDAISKGQVRDDHCTRK
jgi:hypothetical protein